MKAIVNGRIVTPAVVVEGKALLYDEKIRGIVTPGEVPADAEILDAENHYVIPGLVDMHIHGYMGEDASDGSFEGLKTMARGVAKNGVTSFLPTTMTVSYDELRLAFSQIRRARGYALSACAMKESASTTSLFKRMSSLTSLLSR